MISAVLAAFLLAYSGMLGLCLGLERHFKQLWQRQPSFLLIRVLRAAGWLGLVASLVVCGQVWGWAMGAVACLGLISLAGLALVFLLPYTARLSLLVAALGWPVLGILGLL
ncbi:hypothetical protein D3C76_233110 [compost metagenome]